jgi:MOB kinase activator 1
MTGSNSSSSTSSFSTSNSSTNSALSASGKPDEPAKPLSEFEAKRKKREEEKAKKAEEAAARREKRLADRAGTKAGAAAAGTVVSTTTTGATEKPVSEFEAKRRKREEDKAKKATEAAARREARANKKAGEQNAADAELANRQRDSARCESDGYITGDDVNVSGGEDEDEDEDEKASNHSRDGSGGRAMQDSHQRYMTLGSEFDFVLPQDLELNEWFSMNAMDFHNELQLLTGLVADSWAEQKRGEGFPKGFEYRWSDGKTIKTPIRCCTGEYVDFVMQWVEEELENEDLFPQGGRGRYPADFRASMGRILTRLFRVYVLLYTCHLQTLETLGAAQHLNTCFKHFTFFCFEFDAVSKIEFKALKGPVSQMKVTYTRVDHAGIRLGMKCAAAYNEYQLCLFCLKYVFVLQNLFKARDFSGKNSICEDTKTNRSGSASASRDDNTSGLGVSWHA